jgi:phosphomannomutase
VASIIGHVGGNIGFVSCSDMGRLSVVTEDAHTPSEECSFALVADHTLKKRAATVVTNCCTTKAIDDIAAAHGVPVVKTPVGQAYVLSALADENGAVGGEGSGSAAVPEFSRAFDAFLMMGLILEDLAETGQRASARVHELQRYHVVKKAVRAEAHRGYRALEFLEQEESWRKGGRKTVLDGLRIDWWDGWVHVRASRTEPMIRIISESPSRQTAEDRAQGLVQVLEQEL